jgi:hypothetical protein
MFFEEILAFRIGTQTGSYDYIALGCDHPDNAGGLRGEDGNPARSYGCMWDGLAGKGRHSGSGLSGIT